MRLHALAAAALLSCASSPPPSGDAIATASASPRPVPAEAPVEILAGVSDVAERAVRSVVNVSTKQRVETPPGIAQDPFFHDFFFGPGRGMPAPRERERVGQGSGVIIDAVQGLVVTNNHVVDGADEVEVSLPDGRKESATVVGADPKSDLAVLRMEDVPDDLEALSLGDSSTLRLGEVVLAIGNPFGVGQTVTMGIVSAVGRANMGIVDYEDFIQTDAAINPGNSGGALVNMRGELVGINTAIVSRSGGYQGIGFAIPTRMVQPIVDSILDDGTVQRGFLGIRMQELDEELADALGLDDTEGILVSDVVEDSPADRAGLERGDVIVSLDGDPVSSMARFRNRVAAAGPDAPFTCEIVRKGKRKTVRGKLDLLEGESSAPEDEEEVERLDGLKLGELGAEERERLRIPGRVDGVVVTAVEPRSRAARAGLRPGDVITEVNRQAVGSPADVRRALDADTALLLVYRDGTTMYVVLKR